MYLIYIPIFSYSDGITSRKHAIMSPQIKELLKELKTQRLRKHGVEEDSMRYSQEISPGMQVLMDLGLVQDTRFTPATEEESYEPPESSKIPETYETSDPPVITISKYMKSSETPEPYDITTSEYPETSETFEPSEIQDESNILRKSYMLRRAELPRTTALPRRSNIPQRFGMPRSSVMPKRSDMHGRTDLHQSSVLHGRFDMSGRAELPRSSIIPGRSDKPIRTDIPRSSVTPGISDKPIITDIPQSLLIPGRSDMPTRTDIPRSSVMPGRSDMSGWTDMPGQTDIPRSSVMPGRTETLQEQQYVGPDENLDSDSDTAESNISCQPSDASLHTEKSRTSRVGSILDTKIVEEGKNLPKELRKTIRFPQGDRWSILTRVIADWEMAKKLRQSEDRSTGDLRQYDTEIIDWNTVKDPRRQSIKKPQEDSQLEEKTELPQQYIGSLLHAAMARWKFPENQEKTEEISSPETKRSYESLSYEFVSLLTETMSEEQIPEHEQEKKLNELKDALELVETTVPQVERIGFKQYKQKITQEMPKVPQKKHKKAVRYSPTQIPFSSVFPKEFPGVKDPKLWLPRGPKVRTQGLSSEGKQGFLPTPNNESAIRRSVLQALRDRQAKTNESDYTKEGSISETDDRVETRQIYVKPPKWSRTNFDITKEHRSILISTRIRQIQRQQKTLNDIKKAQVHQSTIRESINPPNGHGSIYPQQSKKHPLHTSTPKRKMNAKLNAEHKVELKISPECFNSSYLNDTALRDSVDLEFDIPTEYLQPDIQWEKTEADRADSYSEMERMMPGRSSSYLIAENMRSEPKDSCLEPEIPTTSRRRSSVAPEEIMPSTLNQSIETENMSPVRKISIPENENNIHMQPLPANESKKKTTAQLTTKQDSESQSTTPTSRPKTCNIKYETVSTTIAEMEREQNRGTLVPSQKRTLSSKIKSKPATTTVERPPFVLDNIAHQQHGVHSGSMTREQLRASIDGTKAGLRRSNIRGETTNVRRLSSSMSPDRRYSSTMPDESRFQLGTTSPDTLNRARIGSISNQPCDPLDPSKPMPDYTKHPLEMLAMPLKDTLPPVEEELEGSTLASLESTSPIDFVTSRRLSTSIDPDSPLYLRDPTIQLVSTIANTSSACDSPLRQRDPTIRIKSCARKTPPFSTTVPTDTSNIHTVKNSAIVQKESTLSTIKVPQSVQQNTRYPMTDGRSPTTDHKISERSPEYVSPRRVERNIRCSDFHEKFSNESVLNNTMVPKAKSKKHGKFSITSTISGKDTVLNTCMIGDESPSPSPHISRKIRSLLNKAMIEDENPSLTERTTKYSQDSITTATEADINIPPINASFYDFLCKYHKPSQESITLEEESVTHEETKTQRPQSDAEDLNFLRLAAIFSDETIPRQMYADLTKIFPNLGEVSSTAMDSGPAKLQRFLINSLGLLRQIAKECPELTLESSETPEQLSKIPAELSTTPIQLSTTPATFTENPTQPGTISALPSPIKPTQTITGVGKQKEALSSRRKGSILPMFNLSNLVTTPEASLATWIRERRTSHAIPIPNIVIQNPESLLPAKKRPIPEWRKDERPFKKLQSLVPSTETYRLQKNTRRALQNKVSALRRSNAGRQRRLAVPGSTLNWRKFGRSSTMFTNRSKKSARRDKKFAKQYKKSLTSIKSQSELLMFKQFLLGHVIGSGSFGTVRMCENLYKEAPCAVKMEYISKRKMHLSLENRIYKRIGRAVGFPEIYHYEQFVFNKYNALVMELLGPSLQEIYKKITRFSLKTVLQIIQQVLRRVEFIHQKGILHRDIKPANFLVGRLGTRKQNLIYMVDFGMAKIYKNARGKHIKYSPAAGRFGTAKYASINAHLGREHSRRDDLEACGYMFIYFARGSLPWQGLDITNAKQKYKKIGELKQNTPLEKLCEGLPAEFLMYMKYVRRLKFSQEPDYSLLRNMFSELYFRREYFNRRRFDWTGNFKNTLV